MMAKPPPTESVCACGHRREDHLQMGLGHCRQRLVLLPKANCHCTAYLLPLPPRRTGGTD
jgi:hypothetical protein